MPEPEDKEIKRFHICWIYQDGDTREAVVHYEPWAWRSKLADWRRWLRLENLRTGEVKTNFGLPEMARFATTRWPKREAALKALTEQQRTLP